MIPKLNFTRILTSHVGTLKKFGSEKCSKRDIAVFYGAPVVVSFYVTVCRDLHVGNGQINFLATIFSIFVGLLLNLLVLIVSVSSGPPSTEVNATSPVEVKRLVLTETFFNISYAILIAVLLIILLFAVKLMSGWALQAVSFLIYFIVGNFLLTLLMILKRVHGLFAS